MKKVLHIISDLDIAGAQTVVMNFHRNFKNDPDFNMVVGVIGYPHYSPYEIECRENGLGLEFCNYKAVKHFPIISTIINWVCCQISIIRLIRRVNPDIIQLHETNLLAFATLPMLFTRNKVLLHTLHCDPYVFEARFVRWARFAFHIVGVYPICVSEVQAKKAEIRYGIKEYSIIKNGIDFNRFGHTNRAEIRNELGIPENYFVIGCVGRLDHVKNHLFLVKLFAEFFKRNKNSILLLVGEGVEKNSIVNFSKELGVASNIIFTGIRTDVERIYYAMDVFMLTSFFESSSIVTVEAQIAGIRCVVSDSIPESVVLTPLVNRLPLSAPIDRWIDAIEGDIPGDITRGALNDVSMEKSVSELKKLYFHLLSKRKKGE